MKPQPPQDMWEKIAEVTQPPQKRPADVFTASEYASRFGLTISATRSRLRELVDKGKLDSVVFLENSRHTTGYRIKGGSNVDK